MSRRDPQVDVYCEGKPKEFGYAIGSTLKEVIQEAENLLTDYEMFRMAQPWWCPFPMYRYLAKRQARNFLEAPIRQALPQHQARMEGIAEGAGVGLDTVYLYQAFEMPTRAIETSAIARTTLAPHAACTAVAFTSTSGPVNGAMIAHNFDAVDLVADMLIIRDNRPDDAYRSLTMTAAPLSGAICGVNEHGLAITYNSIVAMDTIEPRPPVSLVLDAALSRCRDVGEAIAYITSTPRCGGAALMLADADGEVASVELSNQSAAVRKSMNGRYLFHSNRYRSRRMRSAQVPEDACFDQRTPPAIRGQRVADSPERRDARLETLLQRQSRFDWDDIHHLMSDHGPTGQPDNGTICMHSDYWSTNASMHLVPSDRTIRIAYGRTCQATYKEFSL